MTTLTYPHKHGNGTNFRATLRAIIGPNIEALSMIDLMCCEGTGTRDMPFREITFVDVVPRDALHGRNFVQISVLSDHDVFNRHYDVAICADGIEHLTREEGQRLIERMKAISDKQIIFTPLGEYMTNPTSTHPDSHRSGWTHDDFPGWAHVVVPQYHQSLGPLGAFFAWRYKSDEVTTVDFVRARPELEAIWDPNSLAQHVKNAIDMAERGESKLSTAAIPGSTAALTVPAFSGLKIKHLLNNLCAMDHCHYLEVGVHKGGTFCAAMFGNTPESALAVDDWSEFTEGGRTKAEFVQNMQRFAPSGARFIERDCFELTTEDVGHKINCYLYDGNHSEEAQYKALTHFLPMMADEFVWLVDDMGWAEAPGVEAGTRRAIADTGVQVVYERDLQPPQPCDSVGWWNGFGVFVLRKP